MFFMYVGIILIILKFAGLHEFFTKLSWLWVILPFVLAIIWWEFVEPAFGLDRKEEEGETPKQKKMRLGRRRK